MCNKDLTAQPEWVNIHSRVSGEVIGRKRVFKNPPHVRFQIVDKRSSKQIWKEYHVCATCMGNAKATEVIAVLGDHINERE